MYKKVGAEMGIQGLQRLKQGLKEAQNLKAKKKIKGKRKEEKICMAESGGLVV